MSFTGRSLDIGVLYTLSCGQTRMEIEHGTATRASGHFAPESAQALGVSYAPERTTFAV